MRESGESTEVGRSRLMSSVQGLAATLMAIFQTRLALLATELEEDKQRLLSALAWGAVAILMGTVASVFLAAFITVLFWDTHPLLVLGGLTLAFSLACLWAAQRVMAMARTSHGLLAASLAELQADQDAMAAASRHVSAVCVDGTAKVA
jgi:uncharacterized membrane protein YqjE